MKQGSNVFKQCSCGQAWHTSEEFLSDPNIHVSGYMAHFDELILGLFIFQHNLKGCDTSLAIKAGAFTDLYKGEVFNKRLKGTDDCPDYCSNESQLELCPAKCECAWVREVLQIVKDWPKAFSVKS